jgi:hypothetical protein
MIYHCRILSALAEKQMKEKSGSFVEDTIRLFNEFYKDLIDRKHLKKVSFCQYIHGVHNFFSSLSVVSTLGR